MRLWWKLPLFLVLSGVTVQAQEALRSAIAVDRSTAARSAAPVQYTDDQPHAGPVQFSLGALLSAEFNDNVNASETNPESDIILRPGADLGVFWPATDTLRLNLGLGLSYAVYLEGSQSDRLEVSPDSILSFDLGFQDGFLTFFNQFSYQQSVVAEASLADTQNFPRLDNTLGVRATWFPHKWILQGGISHNNYWSTEDVNAYLDRASQYLFARAGWRFSEATQAGAESSFSITDYRLAQQSDNRSLSVGAYGEWQITSRLRAGVRGGPVFYVFESRVPGEADQELSSYYVGLDLNHRATERISHGLIIRREVRLGQNLGSDYIEEFSAGYNANWAATDRLGIGLGLNFIHGVQPIAGLTSGAEEIYDQFSVTPGVSYRFTPKLSGSLRYSFYVRESNLANRNYTQNRVTLGATYQF